MNGMSGMFIVDGVLDNFPHLTSLTERIILLKDFQNFNGTVPTEIDSNADTNRLVNGLVNPLLTIAPGELQLWRIGNLGADIYYNITLGDGITFFELSRDGNVHNLPVPYTFLFIPPSTRLEVFVFGPPAGLYNFTTLAMVTGPNGDAYPDTVLLTLQSTGTPVASPLAIPNNISIPADLTTAPIAKQRTIIFSETPDGLTFFLNGKQYNETRVDTVVNLGDVEEWELLNTAQEFHVFHIHQVPFQVIEVNYESVPYNGRQDTVNLPFSDPNTNVPGQVKVLLPFTNPNIQGKFVYHCHILRHEDGGMMNVIQVVANTNPTTTPTTRATATPSQSTTTPQGTTTTNASPDVSEANIVRSVWAVVFTAVLYFQFCC